jgi:hypothetical protein
VRIAERASRFVCSKNELLCAIEQCGTFSDELSSDVIRKFFCCDLLKISEKNFFSQLLAPLA